MNNEDPLRVEYPAGLIRSGVRGRYANRYREGTNIVLVEPDLHKIFPDSESVNRALRRFAEEHQMSAN
ncbi:MAG: hypothetical protein DM484_08120 [Candidatus Methylumidiphilus alinenensis]|uniref:Uncharacterized protein n=1 Tax=Candidatus Methylumidiphilus alinenensis TaxID=2202197 RepID=A0A2W4RIP0_9GAMM|nr:MAG: hypothetical protein DM484_08120 [Candidatus Methylumidiphilus alinenensis]